MKLNFLKVNVIMIVMLSLLGIAFCSLPTLFMISTFISNIFIRFLKFLSLPIIFLSIASTISSMGTVEETKRLGKQVITYTLLTTIIAASLSLFLFLFIQPARQIIPAEGIQNSFNTSGKYLEHLINIIPLNIVQPFYENNVVSVAFMAFLISVSTLFLPEEKRCFLHNVFSSLYETIMNLTKGVLKFLPLAIIAFVCLFIKDLKNGISLNSLGLYLTTLIIANLLQAAVILPVILHIHKISPFKTFKGMLPALFVAFFSKSSCAAMPTAIKCAEGSLSISPTVARFTFPLCTTINMNACASFILITVLFVSNSYGVFFTPFELIGWVFISTIAAIGNAGVPMGCYFLTTVLLSSLNVPLHLMGIILPFYAILDMFESATNLWSDACIATIVNRLDKENIA